MQAKEILTGIYINRALMDSYKAEIHFWDSMVDQINDIGGHASLCDKLTAFRDSLLKGAESIVSETKAALDLVKGLEDTRQKELIVGHYFQGKPFSKVATDIGLSLSQTKRIHTAALEQLDLVLEKEGAAS